MVIQAFSFMENEKCQIGKKLIAAKIAIAKKGNTTGKVNANTRAPAGQTEV